MTTFTASRLSAGNFVFPSKIIIDAQGVTLIHPALFSGREKTIPFTRISSVDIASPFLGYSTITIETTGEGSIRASGFLKSAAKEMKEMILAKIN